MDVMLITLLTVMTIKRVSILKHSKIVMTIYVFYASQIAAQVGSNPFVSVEDTICKVWKRRDNDSYSKALERNKKKEHVIKFTPQVQIKVDNITETATPEDISEKIQEILREEKSICERDVTQVVYTTRGKRDEEASTVEYTRQSGKVVNNKNDKLYKKYFPYDGKKEFMLCGKTDGITEDNVLIEVKNRQKRIMSPIPRHELIQVHVYMILTGLRECTFVQTCGDTTISENIEFDKALWEETLEKLKDYSRDMDKVLETPKLQDQVISASTEII